MAAISLSGYALALFPAEMARFVFTVSIGYGFGASICPAMGALIYHFLGF